MTRWERDFLRMEMKTISEAGISLTPLRQGRRPTFLIETTTNDEAQAVWSYLTAERCLIEPRPAHPGEDRETRYPTSYLHRLRRDEDRRRMFGMGLGFLVLPVLLSLPIVIARVLRVTVPELSMTETLLAILAVGVLVQFAFVIWLFNDKDFGMDRLLARFALGAAFGFVWVIVLGQSLSAAALVGALWTFSGANLVWGMTIGFEHWRLNYEFEHVEGRLLHRVALRRLEAMGDKRRTPPFSTA